MRVKEKGKGFLVILENFVMIWGCNEYTYLIIQQQIHKSLQQLV